MLRLLVADGDAAARESAAALVCRLLPGAIVAEAGSYAEAMDRALAMRPHGALVALQLGDRSGVELVERLTAAGADTAFCVTASSEEPELICRAMRAGARDYLLTPLRTAELWDFLRRVLPKDEDVAAPLVDPILHVEYASLSPLAARMLLMVRESFRDPSVTLTSMAEGLNMNSRYLGRVFHRQTGMKLSGYLLACRMEEAGRLIRDTREKISVVAGMVGYSQLNHFYVHFRSYFGVSPGALRRSGPAPESGEDRP